MTEGTVCIDCGYEFDPEVDGPDAEIDECADCGSQELAPEDSVEATDAILARVELGLAVLERFYEAGGR